MARSLTSISTSEPVSSSAATARRLITVGELASRTAERTADVLPSSRTAVGGPRSRAASASSSASRVPEPASRVTRGVAARASTGTVRRFAHGCSGFICLYTREPKVNQ